MNKELELKLKNLPTSCGVYLFKNKKNQVIYIGKAKQLRSRVRSYFRSSGSQDHKTNRLSKMTVDFDLMVTDNEVESLILESNLIKEYKPLYNIKLKDDKHYPYVKVTVKEPFPRVLVVRRIEKDGSKYFGPFTNVKGMRKTVKFLSSLFKIRTCSLIIPHPTGKKQNVCLDYHIKRCGGPCEFYQTEEEYKELVDSVLMVLSGKSQTLTNNLKEKMEQLSNEMNFEEAALYRDRIDALNSMMFRQKVDVGENVNRDIVSLSREATYAVAVVMQIREGLMIGRQDFQISAAIEETDNDILETFLSQYYNYQPNLPSEIFLPYEISHKSLFEEWFQKLSGRKLKLIIPQKGEKQKLVSLADKNARLLLDELLIRKLKQADRTSKMVIALKNDLNLSNSPRTIVCFDISNTGETDTVGSCVYFANGKPKKKEYRHFKIKGVKGQDDFKMMREIIGRYFFKIKEEKTKPPDLVVVDGGKGQLSSAVKELLHLGFDQQPVIGLAKRLEEVFVPGNSQSLSISKSSPGLILLKLVRDEAHRFAITYNRKVRSKRTIKSKLDSVAGIGPAKRDQLLKRFGSVARIKKLTQEELSSEKGVTEKLARNILSELNK